MTPSVLSILSHVVHGYVGNRSAAFTFQYRGWDADIINTTNFSNHPGFGQLQGTKADAGSIANLFKGLAAIVDLKKYDVISVGYCPSGEVMKTIYANIEPIVLGDSGDQRPALVVDPVLGDNGRLYVPEEIVMVHREFLRRGHVTLTTPNQFELELLTGLRITDLRSAKVALEKFHADYNVPFIVLSSFTVEDDMYSVGFAEGQVFYLPIEKIECSFNGCGDIFAAILTHEFFHNNCKLNATVLGSALYKIHLILANSFEEEKLELGVSPKIVKTIRLVSLRRCLDAECGDVHADYL